MNAAFAVSRRVHKHEREILSLRKELEEAEVRESVEVGKGIQLEGERDQLLETERRLTAQLNQKTAECTGLAVVQERLQHEKAKADNDAREARRDLAAAEKEIAALKKRAKLLQEAGLKAKQDVAQKVKKQMEDFIESPALAVFTGKQKAEFITDFVRDCSDKVPELPALLNAYKESKSLPAQWFEDVPPLTPPAP